MHNMKKKKIIMFCVLVMSIVSVFVVCAPQQMAPHSTAPKVAARTRYVLGQRDVIDLEVVGHPELSGTGTVDKNGMIELPLTDDFVHAAGKTIEELEVMVGEVLGKYVIKSPRIRIRIAEYESKMVYVVGEVAAPGKYPLQDYTIRVRDIIFAAGLTFDGANETQVYIIKPDLTDPTYTTVNLRDILYKGILKDNIVLEPGDIVYVRPTMIHKINKSIDQILTPASKAAALFYMYSTWSNIITPGN